MTVAAAAERRAPALRGRCFMFAQSWSSALRPPSLTHYNPKAERGLCPLAIESGLFGFRISDFGLPSAFACRAEVGHRRGFRPSDFFRHSASLPPRPLLLLATALLRF